MITAKTLYKVPNCLESFEGIASIPFGVWCTNNQEVRNMTMEEAWKSSHCISGKLIDKNISECLIFAFLDEANYGYEKGKFVEIAYEELIAECEPIDFVTCEREEWVDIDKAKMHGYFL